LTVSVNLEGETSNKSCNKEMLRLLFPFFSGNTMLHCANFPTFWRN